MIGAELVFACRNPCRCKEPLIILKRPVPDVGNVSLALVEPVMNWQIECQRLVTTLHLVTTASVIWPASCAQATSSTFTEISLPTSAFNCAA